VLKKGISITEAQGLGDTKVRARWRTYTFPKPRHRLRHHLPFFKEPVRTQVDIDHEAVGYFTVEGPVDMSMTMTHLGIVWETGRFPYVDTLEDNETAFAHVEWEIVETAPDEVEGPDD
jgi:hypothetical protein